MDFIKTLKKKTESKLADIRSDHTDSFNFQRKKPNFDYKSLELSDRYGPFITEDIYDHSCDIRDFLKKFNNLYPTSKSHEPGFLEMQIDAINRTKDMLLSLPTKENVKVASQPKWFKMYSNEPVKDITIEDIYYCNDITIFRFLRSYDYKVEKTYNLLLKTLSWRRLRDPFRISPEMVKESLCDNMLYRKGYDYFGCPIVYFRPVKETSVSLNTHVMALYYTLERALQTCLNSQGNDKVYVIVDLKDWSLTRLPPMELVLETARALVDHYTETIDELILVDPPPLIDPVYQMIKCVIPTSTVKKIILKPRSQKLFDYLRFRIPLCFLEKSLGGTSEAEVDHDEYWKVEESQYELFVNNYQNWLDKNREKYLNKDDFF